MKNCYPAFAAQFDTLDASQVIWQPYAAQVRDMRYPGGISLMCTRDANYWMTKSKIMFDVTVEEMAQHRVMRQFGARQVSDPLADAPLQGIVHRFALFFITVRTCPCLRTYTILNKQYYFSYTRQGNTRTAARWLDILRPFVDDWTTASTRVWELAPFDQASFHDYLRSYMGATRLYLIPPTAPEDIHQASTSDMYPLESTTGFRHHAVSILTFFDKSSYYQTF